MNGSTRTAAIMDWGGAGKLRAHLLRPVVSIGPMEPRSPEFDIIEAMHRLRNPAEERDVLASASAALLDECRAMIASGDRSSQLVSLVARLGFLCSSLSLDVDAKGFFLIALDLTRASGLGMPVDVDDLFLILRAAGRLDIPAIPIEERQLFWATLLEAPHKGVRTLAAQKLVRLDPARELLLLERAFAAGINEPLVAHEMLQRFGDADSLAAMAVAGLDPAVLTRLETALEGAGHSDASAAIARRRGVAAHASSIEDRIAAALLPS